MSRTRKALIHYFSKAESKFTKIKLENNTILTLSLKPERFPHLIGIQYISKYNNIPSITVNHMILSRDILHDKFVDSLDKKTKAMVKDKTKAILGDFDFEKMKVIFIDQGKKIVINKNLNAELITLNYNKTKTKIFAILYTKDRYNIYHPKSTLLLRLSSTSAKALEQYRLWNIVSTEHAKNLKL